jgi:uncharacterized protein YciI
MKHFIVEATYLAPLDKIREVTPEHRAWLQKGYDAGLFLCSGPQDPPVGGFLVARAPSKSALETMFAEEPFQAGQLASFTFKEFHPVKRQPWTEDWFKAE